MSVAHLVSPVEIGVVRRIFKSSESFEFMRLLSSFLKDSTGSGKSESVKICSRSPTRILGISQETGNNIRIMKSVSSVPLGSVWRMDSVCSQGVTSRIPSRSFGALTTRTVLPSFGCPGTICGLRFARIFTSPWDDTKISVEWSVKGTNRRIADSRIILKGSFTRHLKIKK